MTGTEVENFLGKELTAVLKNTNLGPDPSVEDLARFVEQMLTLPPKDQLKYAVVKHLVYDRMVERVFTLEQFVIQDLPAILKAVLPENMHPTVLKKLEEIGKGYVNGIQ